MKTIWVITNEHRLATILHPKLKNFECCYDEKERAISALKLAFDKYQSNNSSSACVLDSNQVISPVSSDTNTNIVSLKSKKLLTQCFDTMDNSDVKVPNPHKTIEDYLNSEFSYNYNENDYEDGDIILEGQFPVLSALAKERTGAYLNTFWPFLISVMKNSRIMHKSIDYRFLIVLMPNFMYFYAIVDVFL